MHRRLSLPPVWTSALAVIAHPDDALFGLGAILDAFVLAGAKIEVLCLSHRRAWPLQGAPETWPRCVEPSWLRRMMCSDPLAPRCTTARVGP